MNKLIIFLALFVAFAGCKGPGSGPLVKNSFEKTDITEPAGHHNNKSAVVVEKMNVSVEPCNGCVTISKLIANKKMYSGKNVKVTGKVTKFNPQIMGKNWIHIQDGSEFQGVFDLTITSDQQVSLGDTVTFEGNIVLDKDLGSGYFYSVLMEDGKQVH